MYGIVVGIDGSPEAERALAWAVEEAKLRGSPLTIVTCLGTEHLPTWVGEYPVESPELDVEGMRDAARTSIEKLLTGRQDAPMVEHAVKVELGHAADVLLQYAADADHVVVGSRGLGGFQRLLLGSVSTALVHHAPCPVTVVRAPAPS